MKKANAYSKELIEKTKLLKNNIDCIFLHNIEKLENLKYYSFSRSEPYDGEKRNRVFLTKNDAYKGNSPLLCRAEYLHSPHTNADDRGYIKGVALDLHNYLLLRSCKNNFIDSNTLEHWCAVPTFRKSKFSANYINACEDLRNNTINKLMSYCESLNERMNEYLQVKTGMSLLYYVENI